MTTEFRTKQEGFAGQKSCVLPLDIVDFCRNDAFCKNLYVTDIGFYPNAALHNRERIAGSPQYILIHCVKGSGWYKIHNERYTINTNDFIVVPANTRHEYGAAMNEPWSIYWVHFTGDFAKFYYDLLSSEESYTPKKAIFNTNRHLLFEDILHHLELMNNNDNIICGNSYFYAFLATFIDSQMKISSNENDMIQKCISFMKDNLNQNLHLDDLVKQVAMSPSHISSEFKKKMKYSPMQLFTSLKIQKACQLLSESTQSVKIIGLTLGYTDQYHFSRVFKNVMGVSPNKFRKGE